MTHRGPTGQSQARLATFLALLILTVPLGAGQIAPPLRPLATADWAVSASPGLNQVTLEWPPVHLVGEPVSAYRILRGEAEGAVQFLAETSDTLYVDDALPPGTPFRYEVHALTSAGRTVASFALTSAAAMMGAGWGNNVLDLEPNHPLDRGAGHMMWPTAPGNERERIYFDAFLIERNLGGLGTPITGTVGASYQMFAFLATATRTSAARSSRCSSIPVRRFWMIPAASRDRPITTAGGSASSDGSCLAARRLPTRSRTPPCSCGRTSATTRPHTILRRTSSTPCPTGRRGTLARPSASRTP